MLAGGAGDCVPARQCRATTQTRARGPAVTTEIGVTGSVRAMNRLCLSCSDLALTASSIHPSPKLNMAIPTRATMVQTAMRKTFIRNYGPQVSCHKQRFADHFRKLASRIVDNKN